MDYWLRYAGSEENVLFRRPKNSCVVIEELLLSSKKKSSFTGWSWYSSEYDLLWGIQGAFTVSPTFDILMHS